MDHVVSGLITQIWDIAWHQIWYGFKARDVNFPKMCKYTNSAASTAHTMHHYNLDRIKLTGYYVLHVYEAALLINASFSLYLSAVPDGCSFIYERLMSSQCKHQNFTMQINARQIYVY